MRWIVDGMNLIGSNPDGWWRDRPGARRRLVEELAEFGGGLAETDSIGVVFDGRPVTAEIDDGMSVGVAVEFAPGGPNAADERIGVLVREGDASSITVVSSDKALVADVIAAGAAVVGVGEFRRRLGTN